MQPKHQHICLAVDPGYGRLGLAVIAYEGQRVSLLHSECVETPTSLPFGARLQAAATQCEKLIKKFSPQHVAMESLFFSKNTTTALKVAELRGALIYLCATHDIEVCEYNPSEIKVAVTGYGKSGKAGIATMVQRLLGPSFAPKKKMLDDEMDAIAIGLTHVACFPQEASRRRLLQK